MAAFSYTYTNALDIKIGTIKYDVDESYLEATFLGETHKPAIFSSGKNCFNTNRFMSIN
jgi:hypothetical protein